ncbi:MAG: hypothetical protein KKF77_14795 [Proteobacteria bacterium]|nr:hypothetical protein [Pseudomonadota bacterium]
MHWFKKSAAALLLALLVLGSAASALASHFAPTALTSLTAAGEQVPLVDLYGKAGYVTPLGFESTRTLDLRETMLYSTSAPLFTNQDIASTFGQSKYVANLLYLGISDTTVSGVGPLNSVIAGNISQNLFFELTKTPFTLQANGISLTLPVGAILVFHDEFATWDKDYNDFVFAISHTAPTVAPTPIPGAVWLLGSGLLGLAGFKRSRRNQG